MRREQHQHSTRPVDASRILRAAFVLERHLGHQTFADNLRRHVGGDPTVRATWIDVTYAPSGGVLDRLPIGGRVRGTVHGRGEVRSGLRHTTADVTFFNTQVPAVIAGRMARRGPYVLCTDITPLQYDGMAESYGHTPDRVGPIAAVKHELNRRVMASARHVIAWSSWVRGSLICDYGVAPERVTVIPPGVDTARWTPASADRDGPLRILFVGGDLDRKGGATLLDAFSALPEGAAELTLVTRTRDPGVAGVRVVHGMVPNSAELLELFRSSDVFVLPSEAEAFGIAAAEAAATGLPTVASRVGGLTDIVVDGDTGYLIAPGDSRHLMRALATLAADHDLRRRLGGAARERAVTCFDAEQNARALVSILRSAAVNGEGIQQ